MTGTYRSFIGPGLAAKQYHRTGHSSQQHNLIDVSEGEVGHLTADRSPGILSRSANAYFLNSWPPGFVMSNALV